VVKRGLTITALLGAASLGCTVSFDPGQLRFSCGDGECPAGQRCINEICQLAGDGGNIDADLPCDATAHLVLSEVKVTPDAVEFVEIYNPTDTTVDLTNVYLSDDQDYGLLPAFVDGNQASTLTSSDFIFRFPSASTIDSMSALTIAFDGDSFESALGVAPDLTESDLVRVFPATGSASLSNDGESLVLFQWDGSSDLVFDLDAVLFGDPDGQNDLADKTGLAVDGPDGGSETSVYLDDAHSAPRLNLGSADSSMQRIIGEGGREGTNGNGLTGDDETSEPLDITWSTRTPTPGEAIFCSP